MEEKTFEVLDLEKRHNALRLESMVNTSIDTLLTIGSIVTGAYVAATTDGLESLDHSSNFLLTGPFLLRSLKGAIYGAYSSKKSKSSYSDLSWSIDTHASIEGIKGALQTLFGYGVGSFIS